MAAGRFQHPGRGSSAYRPDPTFKILFRVTRPAFRGKAEASQRRDLGIQCRVGRAAAGRTGTGVEAEGGRPAWWGCREDRAGSPGGTSNRERDSGDRKGGPHYQVRELSVGRHITEVPSGASYIAKARRNPIRNGDPASLRLALHILPGSHSLTPHVPEHLPLSNSPETTCLSG